MKSYIAALVMASAYAIKLKEGQVDGDKLILE